MSAQNTEDVVWVDVLPSLAGFSPALRSGLRASQGEAQAAGAQAGTAFGAGFAANATKAAEAAALRVSAAQKKVADAHGQLAVAQAKLTDLMDKGNVSASRLAGAEEAVARAQRNVAYAGDQLRTATAQQERAQAVAASTTKRLATETATVKTRLDEGTLASKAFRGTFEGFKGAVDQMGGLAASFAPFAIGGAIYEAVKGASTFDASMVRIQTQAGATAAEVAKFKPAILGLAGQTAQAPEALATSLYHVYSTGLKGSQAIDTVKASAKFASIANADLESTTNALTSTVASGIGGFKGMDGAVAALNTTVGIGDMKLSDLNDALGSGLLSRVKLFGVNIQDVGAALAVFGDNNVRGSDAATMLRTAVEALAVPAQGGQKVLDQLGLSAGQLAKDMQHGGLNQAIIDLHDHLQKAGVTADQVGPIITQAFGKKAGGGVALLLGQFDRLQTKYGDIKKAQDNFSSQWDATTKTASYSFGQLRSTLEAVGIKIGNALLPPLTHVANWFTHTGLPAIEKFGGGLVAAFHSDKVQAVLTGFKNVIVGAFDGVKRAWAEVAPVAQQLATDVGHLVSSFVSSGGLSSLATAVGGAFGGLLVTFKAVAGVVVPMISGLVNWFGKLPGPIQATVAAFAALRGAAAAGLFDGLMSRAGRFMGVLKGIGGAVATTAGAMKTAFAESFAASAEGALGKAKGAVAGLASAAGAAAKGGLSALKGGLSKILGLVGGPWGAAFLGAGLAIAGIISAIQAHQRQVQADTQAVTDWYKAMQEGGQKGADAATQLKAKQDELTAAQAKLNQMTAEQKDVNQQAGRASGAFAAAINEQRGKVSDLSKELANGKQKYDDWWKSLSPAEQATQRVTQAENDLQLAIEKFGPASDQAKDASKRYQQALADQKGQQDKLNQAEQTHLQNLQQIADKELASVSSALAAEQAHASFDQTLQQLNTDTASGSASTAQLHSDQLNVAQSALGWASAAGEAAAAEAKAKGVTDTANASHQAQLQVLQQVAQQMGVHTPDSIKQAIKALQDGTVNTNDLTDAIKKTGGQTVAMSDQFKQEWGQNVQVLHGATQSQIDDLHNLGFTVLNLPNGNVVVSADTKSAREALTQLSNDYTGYSINLGVKLGTGRFAAATGGVLPGFTPGRDVHTFTSPTGGRLDLSGGEAVMRPEFTAGVGAGWVDYMNAVARRLGTAGVRAAMGFANGGVMPMYLTANVGIDQGSFNAAESQLKATFASPYAGAVSGATSQAAVQLGARMAAAIGWTGAQWTALFNLFQRESGWNPYAVNKSSGAYGIPQSLGHGHPFNLGDTAAQLAWGFNYIQGRYGTPANAWAHETAFGWYRDGGVLPTLFDTGGLWAPHTLGANLTDGYERVLSAPQDHMTQRLIDATLAMDTGGRSAPLIDTVNIHDQHDPGATLDELDFRLAVADLGGKYAT